MDIKHVKYVNAGCAGYMKMRYNIQLKHLMDLGIQQKKNLIKHSATGIRDHGQIHPFTLTPHREHP